MLTVIPFLTFQHVPVNIRNEGVGIYDDGVGVRDVVASVGNNRVCIYCKFSLGGIVSGDHIETAERTLNT